MDASLVYGILAFVMIIAVASLVGYVYHTKAETDRKNQRKRSRSGKR